MGEVAGAERVMERQHWAEREAISISEKRENLEAHCW